MTYTDDIAVVREVLAEDDPEYAAEALAALDRAERKLAEAERVLLEAVQWLEEEREYRPDWYELGVRYFTETVNTRYLASQSYLASRDQEWALVGDDE